MKMQENNKFDGAPFGEFLLRSQVVPSGKVQSNPFTQQNVRDFPTYLAIKEKVVDYGLKIEISINSLSLYAMARVARIAPLFCLNP